VAMGILPHQPVATMILISNTHSGITHSHCYHDMYIYIAPLSNPHRVHSEFATLSIWWPAKIEKQGGGVDFISLVGFTSRR
jgi:hypothetical protein